MVLQNYASALNDRGLAKRMIIESGATTLTMAMEYVDKINAGTELFESLCGEEPMDCSHVSEQQKEALSQKKVLEQQNTKIVWLTL